MSCTETQSALSELVDGTLSRDARTSVEAHLDTCADCRAMLADLRRIRESAKALPKMAPPEALWQKVRADFEAGKGLPHRSRSESGHSHRAAAEAGGVPTPNTAQETGQAGAAGQVGGLPQTGKHGGLPHAGDHEGSPQAGKHGGLPHGGARILGFPLRRNLLAGLAAAAVLVLATSAGVYYATRPTAPPPRVDPAAAHVEPAQSVQSIESELQLAVQHYQNAISGLEKVANEGQAVLGPETAAVLAKNNAILDQAVNESQAALRSQPTSEVARASLFEALQRKVTLLRDTIALINEMRKGDQAGTARVVGSLGKS